MEHIKKINDGVDLNHYNKSLNLERAMKYGYRVPQGLIIEQTYFEEVTREFLIRSKESDFINISLAKKFIKNVEFPKLLIEELSNFFGESDHLIVRSNFKNEDSEITSNAGTFESIGPIHNNSKSIINAIKQVWKSGLSSGLDNFRNASIIIQKYIDFQISGVSFTRDPVTLEKRTFTEVTNENGSIESGIEPVFNLYNNSISTGNEEVKSDYMSKSYMELLNVTLNKLENDFESSYGIDVEWGIYNNDVYIVQIRPITSSINKLNTMLDKGPRFINLDSNEIHNFEWPKFYKTLIRKHWIKRHWMKENVNKESNIFTYKLGFLVMNFEDLFNISEDTSDRLLKIWDSKYLYLIAEISGIKLERIFEKESLLGNLRVILKKIGIKENEPLIFWVSEFFIPDISGIVSQNLDGEKLIEYIPGDLAGLKNNKDIEFSRYLINKEGIIKSKHINESKYLYSFDDNFNSVKKENFENTILNEEQVKIISLMPEKMGKIQVDVEWIIKGKKIYIYDVSTESDIGKISYDNNIISSGYCRGNVIMLSEFELQKLEKASRFHVSVDEDFIEQKEISAKPEIYKYIRKLKNINENEDIILHAPYPSSILSLFIPYVGGFIFEKGSIMSHLGIKLRESGTPAIISKVNKFNRNKIFFIENGSLREDY
ncbi:PEP/pyruvate-binding domain-containing protein [Companilactobacillus metriopterae]|uniref:PEP/pyruvate-binding domain-containing protein n=1 Tax=Companilactobacillus metriopterae TaxID=1909267 RepID=UPI00100BACC9|nr:PEP/pyruvate-binding domain-containing protein [Companilactobacillus metriopterae]